MATTTADTSDLTLQPPIDAWALAERRDGDRSQLTAIINENARRLGTGQWHDRSQPVIATGHQAFLWHPGILIKDIATTHAADAHNAKPLHLVVDQDAHDALSFDVPIIANDRLSVVTCDLADHRQSSFAASQTPTGSRDACDPAIMLAQLDALAEKHGASLAVDLSPLRGAIVEAADIASNSEQRLSVAEQVTILLAVMRRPYMAAPPVLFASQLARLPAFGAFVDVMANDACACIDAYNAAANAFPAARIKPMRIETGLGRVELPLWAMAFGQARQRVFVDTDTAELQLDNGQIISRIDAAYAIAPRAIAQSAFMRSWLCDRFVHGTGGAIYDQVTEAWWSAWRGDRLAPVAVASADVTLPLDVPIATRGDVQRAAWFMHHLPHNVDQYAQANTLDASAVQRKHFLLAHMDDDRDKLRRRDAYREVNRINEQLAAAHPQVLRDAKAQLAAARAGAANQQVAGKRDWCFALYPAARMESLRDRVCNNA